MATPLEQLIYAHLSVDAGVLAALGKDPANNPALYLVQLPPGVVDGYYPACTFQRISTVRVYTHSQGIGTPNGSAGWARFQFTIWAKGNTSGAQTDVAVRAIQASMATFNGQPGVVGFPNFILNQQMRVEANVDPPLFKQMFDVRMFYQDQ